MKARVAERGQVTIPQSLRMRLGIRPGTVLDLKIRGSSIVIQKEEQLNPIQQVYGCLGKGLDTDKILAELRGEL